MIEKESLLSKYRRVLLFIVDAAIYWASVGILYAVEVMDQALGSSFPVARSFLPLYICIVLSQIIFRTNDSLWRYASIEEYLRLMLSTAVGYVGFIVVAAVSARIALAALLTFSIACAYIMLTVLARLVYRHYRSRAVKAEQKELVKGGYKSLNVIIIGAGDGGAMLIRDFNNDKYSAYKVLGFFDDDQYKQGRKISGVSVVGGIDDAVEYANTHDVDQVILAIPSLSAAKKSEILKNLSQLKCEIKILPDTVVALSKESGIASEIRSVNIEDLLGRNKIEIDNPEIKGLIDGKTVLVTGGGGSIGSELCRQIASLSPKTLVIFDIAENSSYLLKQELERVQRSILASNPDAVLPQIRVEIGSIRDNKRIEELFNTYKPQIVFHAAAHKHVPLMEWNPSEAIKNNIFGSWNVYQMADKYGAEKLIQISTDKAINPTNVMGASKRYCEYMISAMAKKSEHTKYVAVRFGNVLGSAGSVIPIFTEQIKNGGPVTVTHKEITRYFMTIPEAVSLVLKAGAIAKSGELMVLDMGSPVKIWNLAERMISLSGLKPYKDIDIVETGLRPGEKLYEELLVDYDACKKTEDSKIFIENEDDLKTVDEVEKDFEDLNTALGTHDSNEIVRVMRDIVPTYKTPENVNIH